MTKFKQISEQELIKRISEQIPEINPIYVKKVIRGHSKGQFNIMEVFEWVRYFENDLYKEIKEKEEK